MKIDVRHPRYREEYYLWDDKTNGPAPAAILIDFTDKKKPIMYAGCLHGASPKTIYTIHAFWMPFGVDLMPEDIARCMDHVLPMCERFVEDRSNWRLERKIQRAVKKFLAPEKFMPEAGEILGTVQ